MSGTTDIIKGRAKEAAGAITGNDKLRAKGKADQAIGRIKNETAKGVQKIEKKLSKHGK